MSDENTSNRGAEDADESGRTLQEQQAIAAAMMLGDQMRSQNRAQVYFYAQRIGLFLCVLGFMGIVMLFGYTRLSQGEFNPTVGMLVLGFFMAGGASVSYWAHAQGRRAREE